MERPTKPIVQIQNRTPPRPPCEIREGWNHQPGILLNNRCSVPGDFDMPEQRLGFYQDWRPWESCMCLTHTWSYSSTPPKSRDEIIRMLINNACCDGNLLLSWGPQWDGEFDSAEWNQLLEVRAWLKHNGRAIYGTRGGPWKWAAWGGSTHRDKTVWLHVVASEPLQLTALPGRTVVSTQLLTGEKVAFKQTGSILTVTVPKATPVTIVELSFDQPGSHRYVFSPDSRWAFHTWSAFDQPPVTDLVQLPEHRSVRVLEDNASPAARVKSLIAQPTEFLQLDIGGGVVMDAWMIKPRDFDPMKKFPVLVYVYGEPAGQTVLDDWGSGQALFLAEAPKEHALSRLPPAAEKTMRAGVVLIVRACWWTWIGPPP